MGFTLKIYFLGLIAFAVRPDDSQVTALMIDASHNYYSSDGCPIGVHVPLLLTRAYRCEGPGCQGASKEAVDALFGEDRGHTRLDDAIRGGSVWLLNNSDLSIAFDNAESSRLKIVRVQRAAGSAAPSLPEEDQRQGFDWVAPLSQLQPNAANIDPDVLSPNPSKDLVAARFSLENGTLSTCKLVSSDGEVVSAVSFAPVSQISDTPQPSEESEKSGPKRAVADWLVAEIQIPGCSVEFKERDFETGETRTVKLSPHACDGTKTVEAALLNLPVASFADRDKLPPLKKSGRDDRCGPLDPADLLLRDKPIIGRHFEVFYELAACRPPLRMRPVPYLPALPANRPEEQSEEKTVEAKPPGEVGSALIRALLPDPSRGIYSPPMCPVATLVDTSQ